MRAGINRYIINPKYFLLENSFERHALIMSKPVVHVQKDIFILYVSWGCKVISCENFHQIIYQESLRAFEGYGNNSVVVAIPVIYAKG